MYTYSLHRVFNSETNENQEFPNNFPFKNYKEIYIFFPVILKSLKNMEMKKQTEDEKTELFFCCMKIFHIHYTKTSNLADFKYVIILCISSLDQKIQLLKIGQRGLKLA